MPAALFAPGQHIEIRQLVCLIYGQPGIGKTSIAQASAKPFLLDFDQGGHRSINRRHSAIFPDWQSLVEFQTDAASIRMGKEIPKRFTQAADNERYASITKEYNNADLITVDTVGRLLDLMSVAIVLENSKWGTVAGGLSLQGWGVLKTRFAQWISNLKLSGKDVMLVAHEKAEKKGDDTKFTFEVQGGSYSEIHKQADMIAYCYLGNENNPDGTQQRYLEFRPRNDSIGKDPAAFGRVDVPPLEKNPNFTGKLFADAKSRITNFSTQMTRSAEVGASPPPPPAAPQQSAEEKAETARLCAEWSEWATGKDLTLENANRIISESSEDLKEFPPATKMAVWNTICDSFKVKGWVWNKDSKAFVEAK